MQMTKEHRQKISESLKGKSKSEEHRQKIAQALAGKHKSESHKENIAQALMGNTNASGEHQTEGEYNGKHYTIETYRDDGGWNLIIDFDGHRTYFLGARKATQRRLKAAYENYTA